MLAHNRMWRDLPAWTGVVALGLLAVAWLLPVNVKSLNPALLREAGRGTRTAAEFAEELLVLDKPGPAALVVEAAQKAGDTGWSKAKAAVRLYQARQPLMTRWGGADVALEPLLKSPAAPELAPAEKSTPVLELLARGGMRESLRLALTDTRLPGVQSLLATGKLTSWQRFVPANRAGGQPLDAVVLLTATLWQGGHLAAPLQREVRTLAEAALATGTPGALEDFYLDVLSLGRRLDWVQLAELLRTATSTDTLAQFAHLARVAPEQTSVIYTAALLVGSTDGVARYLITYGKSGAESLRQALGQGEGAVRQLVRLQAPVAENGAPDIPMTAGFALRYPAAALLVKYGAFLSGAFILLKLLSARLAGPMAPAALRLNSGVLAGLMTLLFLVLSEPFLLKAAAASDYQLKLVLPVLAVGGDLHESPSNPVPTMDTTTLLSIATFAALQIGMYIICLMKIAAIQRQPLPAATRLRLMENEENLFDGGLYIGIAGTASALVLQVLGLIEANLLAAYSSNLFGIVCVALVKIRHVRPCKHRLILEAQAAV